jgi:hypothetical protein
VRRVAPGGLVVIILLVSGLVAAEPAAATQRITLARPTVSDGKVVFKGRTSKPRVRVKLQKRRRGDWVNVAKRRANHKGRFRFRKPLPSTDTRYRARWWRNVSRTRRVNAWVSFARPSVSDGTTTFRGRTSKPRVRVRLQRRQTAGWVDVGARRSSRKGRFTFREPVPTLDTRYRARWYRQTSRTRLVRGRDECGVRPRKPDGTLWSCTLAEGFGGSELDRRIWTPMKQRGRDEDSARGALACNVDDPRTVAVRSGALHLTVQRVSDDLRCPVGLDLISRPGEYVSGSVTTKWKFTQKYGRFEARYKSTATRYPGLHEAFWMWPAQDLLDLLWPAAGEIDIAETYSQYPDLVVPFLHYGRDDNGGPVPGLNTAWDCPAQRGEWNTYVLEWTADRLTISANGRLCLTNTSGAPSFRKRFFIMLTQLIGRGNNAYDGRAPLPATMKVDHVKVWE